MQYISRHADRVGTDRSASNWVPHGGDEIHCFPCLTLLASGAGRSGNVFIQFNPLGRGVVVLLGIMFFFVASKSSQQGRFAIVRRALVRRRSDQVKEQRRK